MQLSARAYHRRQSVKLARASADKRSTLWVWPGRRIFRRRILPKRFSTGRGAWRDRSTYFAKPLKSHGSAVQNIHLLIWTIKQQD